MSGWTERVDIHLAAGCVADRVVSGRVIPPQLRRCRRRRRPEVWRRLRRLASGPV
jgi:hypothetical protein